MRETKHSFEPPSGYRRVGRLNLVAARTSLWLNIGAFFLLITSGSLFVGLATLIRADFDVFILIRPLSERSDLRLLWLTFALLGISAVMICIHEALHGLFMRAFTGRRPRFGFKVHPYALLPADSYVSRNRGILVTLAPLVIVLVTAMPVLAVFPSSYLWIPIAFTTMNTACSVGDMVTAAWLRRFNHNVLWGAEETSNVVYEPCERPTAQ